MWMLSINTFYTAWHSLRTLLLYLWILTAYIESIPHKLHYYSILNHFKSCCRHCSVSYYRQMLLKNNAFTSIAYVITHIRDFSSLISEWQFSNTGQYFFSKTGLGKFLWVFYHAVRLWDESTARTFQLLYMNLYMNSFDNLRVFILHFFW